MRAYADTSALVKLVVLEQESRALREWLHAGEPSLVASDITRTELLRALRRVDDARAVAARDVLDALTLLPVTSTILDAAGRLDPAVVRSLDAVHLATALSLGDDLDAFLTYDDQLAGAARSYGLSVLAPA